MGGGSGTGGRDRLARKPDDNGQVISDASPDSFWKPGSRVAQAGRGRGGRSLVRIGNNLRDLSPYQELRLDIANAEANRAIGRVKDVDPDWEPRGSLYAASFGSAVRKANDLVLEAEAQLVDLGRQTHQGLIDIYRRQHRTLDLFGNDRFDREESVVAYGMFDKLPYFGANSKAPPHEATDRMAAQRWLQDLIQTYPDDMQAENIGRKPNDAIFHAEATVLLRMARANGGSLNGRTLEIFVEGPMCSSCRKVLPLLARELGNPTVTFVDLTSGTRMIMRDRTLRESNKREK